MNKIQVKCTLLRAGFRSNGKQLYRRLNNDHLSVNNQDLFIVVERNKSQYTLYIGHIFHGRLEPCGKQYQVTTIPDLLNRARALYKVLATL